MTFSPSLPRPSVPTIPINQGVIYHQANALRLLVRHEQDCPVVGLPDVWWWRHGQDVCVWAESWPHAQTVQELSVAAWDQMNLGQGQWWVIDGQEATQAVFQLTQDRRRH